MTAAAALSFRRVYDVRFADVCRWLRALGIPASEREDIAQEVFIVVERKLPDFDGRDLGAWLYRITANTASDQQRRAWWKNLFRRRSSATLDNHATQTPGPARQLEREEDRQIVWRLLDRLPQKQRVVVVLFEIEGESISDIAALLGIPEATVKTRLHYGRGRLARIADEVMGPVTGEGDDGDHGDEEGRR